MDEKQSPVDHLEKRQSRGAEMGLKQRLAERLITAFSRLAMWIPASARE